MIRNRIFIASTTVAVVFFLTFLGMRLSFLDKSSKPKPKPRAVLNQFAKSASSTLCPTTPDLVPSVDLSLESSKINAPTFVMGEIIATNITDSNASHYILPLQGRSPPRC
jgi:hypothetical protein